ncbi:MAG: molybdopterin-guanine dinucleotide biosynthesis protein B [Clostridiales bacterium]|nr:molybdopterin-guanine dinucleotide biosynthesis protein B [Clostridiales bacterium]
MDYTENTGCRIGITLEEAVDCIINHTHKITRTENLPLLSASGRILAKDMITEMENPPFDRSPIDGYACHSADIQDASPEHPAALKVTEEIDAGQFSNRVVQPGEAVRIMTGAAIPAGCDCCVRQESTDYGETVVSVYEAVPAHGNYCDRGEDFKEGIRMLRAGEKLGYVELANLAAMGADTVPVCENPRIALFTTGDEVMEPGLPLLPGKIYNSNYYLLTARLAEFGITPVWSEHIPDDAGAVADAIRRAAAGGADLILTTGGVSVGKKDILHETLQLLNAEKLFWKVRLKPGSPTVFSVFQGVPVISLSGNPFGALANMELLVRPALEKMTGDSIYHMQKTTAILKDPFPKASRGRRFIRARYRNGEVFLPDGLHSSGVLASMRGCNCLIDIAPGSPALQEGEQVSLWLLDAADGRTEPAADVSENPRVFVISGVKNSGKTTLITKLIPIFRQMGWQVATIKHDGHGFDPDVPGTDSYRHRAAGACGTAIYSDDLTMVIKRNPDSGIRCSSEPQECVRKNVPRKIPEIPEQKKNISSATEKAMIRAFPEADLILLEGFKWTDYPKIEIVREGNSSAPVCDPDTLIGIATDCKDTNRFPGDIPILNLNQPEAIAAAIQEFYDGGGGICLNRRQK